MSAYQERPSANHPAPQNLRLPSVNEVLGTRYVFSQSVGRKFWEVLQEAPRRKETRQVGIDQWETALKRKSKPRGDRWRRAEGWNLNQGLGLGDVSEMLGWGMLGRQ